MNKITASDTILELRDIFSTLGLPEIIVTDNGPTFTSFQFRSFMSKNGIKHVTVSPYHPSSNGLAERSVQTFKKAMIKIKTGSLKEKVCKFLTKCRCTPHSTTSLSPAELLFNRNIKTHLDLLHPCLHDNVLKHQSNQKSYHDKHAKDREICVGDNVFVQNFSHHGDKWLPGVVCESTGPLSFKVKTTSRGIVRRHQDQIRLTVTGVSDTIELPFVPQVEAPYLVDQSLHEEREIIEKLPNSHTQDENETTVGKQPLLAEQEESKTGNELPQLTASSTSNSNSGHGFEPTHTRSGRVIKPPKRLGY
ncbi:endogenous retrovirus group k member 6 pol protein [Plakobranchus ocellatus]|uniref:Endogenous retrovirus group k member 6 pol protein n=1 Tax=Plakobranchus ocellatus TaxID=259542 RepID=A0AAV4E0Z9_9GAST|nr:endogenous retrovirus group k member 6 pol protein [Plakobranchus ocellatus]